MKWHYFLSCTLATGSLVIFPELRIPKVPETQGAHTIRVEQLTYDAKAEGGCSEDMTPLSWIANIVVWFRTAIYLV